jgi:hypothetical protein
VKHPRSSACQANLIFYPFKVTGQLAIEDKALHNSFLEKEVGKTVEYHMTPKRFIGQVTKKN